MLYMKVICDAYTPSGEPIPTNKRHRAAQVFRNRKVIDEVPWYVPLVFSHTNTYNLHMYYIHMHIIRAYILYIHAQVKDNDPMSRLRVGPTWGLSSLIRALKSWGPLNIIYPYWVV